MTKDDYQLISFITDSMIKFIYPTAAWKIDASKDPDDVLNQAITVFESAVMVVELYYRRA
jgi:hypothetical protein